jgi:hypothetical protein
MTFKIDNDALKIAMMRHYEEKLAKELRDMFIYSGNEDTNRIWQLYMEEVRQKEERNQLHVDTTSKWIAHAFIWGIGLYTGWQLWRIFTFMPT